MYSDTGSGGLSPKPTRFKRTEGPKEARCYSQCRFQTEFYWDLLLYAKSGNDTSNKTTVISLIHLQLGLSQIEAQ